MRKSKKATVLLLLLRALCLAEAYDALAFHGNFGDRIGPKGDRKNVQERKPVEGEEGSSSLPETLKAEKQDYSPVLGDLEHQTPHFLRESRQAKVDKYENSRIRERNATFAPKVVRQSTRVGSPEGDTTIRIPQAAGNRTQRVLIPENVGKTRERFVTLSRSSTRPNVPRSDRNNNNKKKEKTEGAGDRERYQIQRQVRRQKQRLRYRGVPEAGKGGNTGVEGVRKDGAVAGSPFHSGKNIGPLRPCANPVRGACDGKITHEESTEDTSPTQPPETGRNRPQQEKTIAPNHASSSVKIIRLEPVELRPLDPTGSGNLPPFPLPGAPRGRDHPLESPTGERFIRHAHGGTGSLSAQIVSVTPWSVFRDPIELRPSDLVSTDTPKAPVIQPVQLDTSNFLLTPAGGALSSHRLEEWLQGATDIKQHFPDEVASVGRDDKQVVYGSFTLPSAAIAAQTITEANSVVQAPPKETRTQQESQGRRETLTKNAFSQTNPASISSTSKSPQKASSKEPFTFEPLQQGVREFLLRQRTASPKGGHSLVPTQDEGLHQHLFEATQDIIEKAQIEERRKALFSTVRSTPPIVQQSNRGTNYTLSARETQGHAASAKEIIPSVDDSGKTTMSKTMVVLPR
ncbi:uncharacterized protein LOC135204596 [Macrobrachium nipponense]|uniref:uncharacterized protein LOC135204596 n=1 Tax=Macrobrachium nipponense TaxID=159736 RepID=UPI0030C88A22